MIWLVRLVSSLEVLVVDSSHPNYHLLDHRRLQVVDTGEVFRAVQGCFQMRQVLTDPFVGWSLSLTSRGVRRRLGALLDEAVQDAA